MPQKISDEELKQVTGGSGTWNGYSCIYPADDGSFFDHLDYGIPCEHWELKNGCTLEQGKNCRNCSHLTQ